MVKCEKCQKEYDFAKSAYGQKFNCPCGHIFIVGQKTKPSVKTKPVVKAQGTEQAQKQKEPLKKSVSKETKEEAKTASATKANSAKKKNPSKKENSSKALTTKRKGQREDTAKRASRKEKSSNTSSSKRPDRKRPAKKREDNQIASEKEPEEEIDLTNKKICQRCKNTLDFDTQICTKCGFDTTNANYDLSNQEEISNRTSDLFVRIMKYILSTLLIILIYMVYTGQSKARERGNEFREAVFTIVDERIKAINKLPAEQRAKFSKVKNYDEKKCHFIIAQKKHTDDSFFLFGNGLLSRKNWGFRIQYTNSSGSRKTRTEDFIVSYEANELAEEEDEEKDPEKNESKTKTPKKEIKKVGPSEIKLKTESGETMTIISINSNEYDINEKYVITDLYSSIQRAFTQAD